MSTSTLIIGFAIGFILTNTIKALHINYLKHKIIKQSSDQSLSDKMAVKHAFKRSLPYSPLFYLFSWLMCSSITISQLEASNTYLLALKTGITWWLFTLILETGIWVLANHRFKVSWKEMYLDAQPWISLSYYAVLISPIVVALVIR